MNRLTWLWFVFISVAVASRQDWGEYDIYTNYYEVTPDTGRTIEVDFPPARLSAVLPVGGQCDDGAGRGRASDARLQ
jgi:hypothetical protein